ncbi:MAG TPA: hypothetical protein VFW92_09365, partial [Candidatus Limnocylindrales bacterium]|nr:hypothetical protein [Candidatus Limnocylindrales bacterium]
MAVRARPAPLAPAPLRPISLRSRLYGFGSVYAKTLRDSRLAFIVVAGLLGGIMLAVGSAIPAVFPTQAARDEVVHLANSLGALAQGLAGKPVNVGTLGGYVQWKYGPFFVIVASLWSILALSGTLASEARRGSLEFVAALPYARGRIAIEKLAAHLTGMLTNVVILAIAAWLAAAAFGSLPGDAISPAAAIAFALWVGLVALAFGGLAFALAPILGRGAAAGISGALLLVGWVANGYAATVPALGAVADLTPWAWTADHLPLAGRTDWVSLVPVAIAAVVLLAAGVFIFARRDLGVTVAIPGPRLPAVAAGTAGPARRSLRERLPVALAWGIGLGLFGMVMAALSSALADAIAQSPDLAQAFGQLFPSIDITSAGGFLELLVDLLTIVVGFAAVTLVSGWASDETSGRLEILLSTPLSPARWALLAGLGVLAAICVLTAVMAVLIGLGAAGAGSDALTPMAGTVVLGLYAAALAGIGFAVGGLVRTSVAAEIVALIVVATYLIDLLAPPLSLPDAIHQLALTAHLGEPMIGVWDGAGIVACLVLAV